MPAVAAADEDTERFLGRWLGRHRVVHPLVFVAVDVVLRAEGALVELVLGALIDDRPLVAREWHAFLVRLEEVLAHLRADVLQDEAQVRRDRVVAQDRVPALCEIADSENCKGAEEGERQQ